MTASDQDLRRASLLVRLGHIVANRRSTNEPCNVAITACEEAKDEINRLVAENERLREAARWKLDVSSLPDGWFLWGLYHQHSRIIYKDQKHEPFSPDRNGQEPWCVNIQHVTGGNMQQGTGMTPQLALMDALPGAQAWEYDNEHRST